MDNHRQISICRMIINIASRIWGTMALKDYYLNKIFTTIQVIIITGATTRCWVLVSSSKFFYLTRSKATILQFLIAEDWESQCMSFNHLNSGLPFFLLSSGWTTITFLDISKSSSLITWPAHFNLFSLIYSIYLYIYFKVHSYVDFFTCYFHILDHIFLSVFSSQNTGACAHWLANCSSFISWY